MIFGRCKYIERWWESKDPTQCSFDVLHFWITKCIQMYWQDHITCTCMCMGLIVPLKCLSVKFMTTKAAYKCNHVYAVCLLFGVKSATMRTKCTLCHDILSDPNVLFHRACRNVHKTFMQILLYQLNSIRPCLSRIIC